MKNPKSKNLLITIKKPLWMVFLFLFIAAILTGCVSLDDPETSQTYRSHIVARVNDGETAGQTFIAYRPGINSIAVWFQVSPPDEKDKGFIRINVYHSSDDKEPFSSIPLSFTEAQTFFPYIINISPDKKESNQNYYLEFEVVKGQLQLFGRNEDAYPHGQFILNQQPLNADLSFQTTYDYDFMAVLDDSWSLLGQIGLFIPLLLVLWLPGNTLLKLIFRDIKERRQLIGGYVLELIASIGLSLAMIPLFVLWFPLIGIPWSKEFVFLIFGLILVLNVYLSKTSIANFVNSFSLSQVKSSLSNLKQKPVQITLLFIFLITLSSRVYMMRDYAAPSWVDSVHHAVVTQAILDQNTIPITYEPYLYSTNTSYHSGFHGLLATYILLSNQNVRDGMLFFGQILNALATLAVFFFTATLLKNKLMGLIAALVPAFFTPMPAYYASWGRYTELTGLLILPIAIFFINKSLNTDWNSPLQTFNEKPSWINWKITILSIVLISGLFLTHVRVTVFLILFIIAAGTILLIRSITHKVFLIHLSSFFAGLGILVIFSIVFVFPWLKENFYNLQPFLKSNPVAQPLFSDFSLNYLVTALGAYILIAAFLGTILALIQLKLFPFGITIWILLMFFSANMKAIKLPGSIVVNNTSVEIMLFMPLALLSSYLIYSILTFIQKYSPTPLIKPFNILFAILCILASTYGFTKVFTILNPSTNLVRKADIQALEWINKNTSADATFLINPFMWGYGIYAGNDGGFWITPETRRKTVPPPVLQFTSDQVIGKRLNKISDEIARQNPDPTELHAILVENAIDYVYIGVRGGILSPEKLTYSPYFTKMYNQNGTWLFKVN